MIQLFDLALLSHCLINDYYVPLSLFGFLNLICRPSCVGPKDKQKIHRLDCSFHVTRTSVRSVVTVSRCAVIPSSTAESRAVFALLLEDPALAGTVPG